MLFFPSNFQKRPPPPITSLILPSIPRGTGWDTRIPTVSAYLQTHTGSFSTKEQVFELRKPQNSKDDSHWRKSCWPKRLHYILCLVYSQRVLAHSHPWGHRPPSNVPWVSVFTKGTRPLPSLRTWTTQQGPVGIWNGSVLWCLLGRSFSVLLKSWTSH